MYVYIYLGECYLHEGKYSEAQQAFDAAEQALNVCIQSEFPDNPDLGFEFLRINRAEIEYFQGLAFEYKLAFTKSRSKYNVAKAHLFETIEPDSIFSFPYYYEMNKKYKIQIAQRTMLTIDLEKSTRFFFPGKVTAKIYYRFKYIPPKSRNFTNFIKLEIFKKSIKDPIHSELIENPQEADELCFEWSGMQENGLPVEQGDYSVQISYYSINSVTNKKVVLSADGYIIFVGHLWIDEMNAYYPQSGQQISAKPATQYPPKRPLNILDSGHRIFTKPAT